jgi:hypothetical protein
MRLEDVVKHGMQITFSGRRSYVPTLIQDSAAGNWMTLRLTPVAVYGNYPPSKFADEAYLSWLKENSSDPCWDEELQSLYHITARNESGLYYLVCKVKSVALAGLDLEQSVFTVEIKDVSREVAAVGVD